MLKPQTVFTAAFYKLSSDMRLLSPIIYIVCRKWWLFQKHFALIKDYTPIFVEASTSVGSEVSKINYGTPWSLQVYMVLKALLRQFMISRDILTSLIFISTLVIYYVDPETLSIWHIIYQFQFSWIIIYFLAFFELFPEHFIFKLMLSLKIPRTWADEQARTIECTILNSYYLYHRILNNAAVNYYPRYVLDSICLHLIPPLCMQSCFI